MCAEKVLYPQRPVRLRSTLTYQPRYTKLNKIAAIKPVITIDAIEEPPEVREPDPVLVELPEVEELLGLDELLAPSFTNQGTHKAWV